MAWTNPDLVVYHGTDLVSANAIVTPSNGLSHSVSVSASRTGLDFGQGFYVTTILQQAIDWANRRQSYLTRKFPRRSHVSAVVRMTISRDALAKADDLVFVTAEDGGDYWAFVDHCRKEEDPGAGRAAPYDVVYGPVARFPKKAIFPRMDQIGLHTDAALALLTNAAIFKQGTPRI